MAKPLIQYKRRSKQRSALRRLLNYLFAGVVLLVLALASYLYRFSITRLTPQEVIYVVQPGATLSGFAQQLYDQGVLPDSHSLVWLAYLKGQQRHLKAGEYRFRKGITAPRLLEQVVSGRVVEYPLTTCSSRRGAVMPLRKRYSPALRCRCWPLR